MIIKKIFSATMLATLFLFTTNLSAVSANEFSGKFDVAVMDLGKHSGAIGGEIASNHLGEMASEYVIEALVESGKFNVISKRLAEENLAKEGLSISGIIYPSAAKKIGKILGVKYLIYGNVSGVTGDTLTIEVFSNGTKVHSVKSTLVVRMSDVTSGDIVTAARGEGVSKSSHVKAGYEKFGYITIGKKKIPQVSVHNAIKKAAYATVDVLIERLFGEKNK